MDVHDHCLHLLEVWEGVLGREDPAATVWDVTVPVSELKKQLCLVLSVQGSSGAPNDTMASMCDSLV